MSNGLELDIISMSDLNRKQIEAILSTARKLKRSILKGGNKYLELLKNTRIAAAFTEQSTRTNLSSRYAALELGADVDGFTAGNATSLGKGETWADTMRMLIGYRNRIIVMRHHLDGAAKWAARVSDVAFEDDIKKNTDNKKRFRTMIVNGGDGKNQHPTQCLLDLFSIQEVLGRLDNFDLGLFNDLKYGRTIHSLITVAPLFKNIKLHLAFPQGFGPEKHYLDYLDRNKVKYTIYDNLKEPLQKVDIAYVTRFQKERFRDENERKNIGGLWSISKKSLEDIKTKKHMKILHPLPIDKEMEEIHFSVHDTDNAYYFQQASNALFVRQSIFCLITGKIGSSKVNLVKKKNFNTRPKLINLPVRGGKKRVRNPRSGYIEKNGIVIDHITANRARRLAGLLGFEKNENLPITVAKCLQSKNEKKDLLKIHIKYELSERDYIKIALISSSVKTRLREPSTPLTIFRPTGLFSSSARSSMLQLNIFRAQAQTLFAM